MCVKCVFVCLFFSDCFCSIQKHPGQGLNASQSCDLHHSCSKCQILNPLCHSEDSYVSLFQCYMMTLNIRDKDIFINYSSLFSFFVFLEPNLWHMEVPGKGSNRSCSHWPIPQPQQLGIRAQPPTYATAHGNARSLTH